MQFKWIKWFRNLFLICDVLECSNYVKVCSCNYRIYKKDELFTAGAFVALKKCIFWYIIVWKGNMIDFSVFYFDLYYIKMFKYVFKERKQ